jgi:hypothetical protein
LLYSICNSLSCQIKNITGGLGCIHIPGNKKYTIFSLKYIIAYIFMSLGYGALEGSGCRVASPKPGINVNNFESILRTSQVNI